MEPEERLTKRERREKARRERKEQEQHAEHEGRTRRALVIAGTLAGVIGVAALIWFTQEEPAEAGIELEPAAAASASEAAGCVRPDMDPPISAAHIPEADAPPPGELYSHRPTWGGPHFENVSPVLITDDPLDERTTTHNMEHGGVVVWYDPDAIDPADLEELEEWASERNRAGFQQRGGAGILVSPYPDQPLPTGGAIALRGWLAAVNCEAFEVDAADAFLALHYGSAGQGPEAFFGPYPEDVLAFAEPPEADPFTGEQITDIEPDEQPDDVEMGEDPDDVEEADDPELDEDEAGADDDAAPED